MLLGSEVVCIPACCPSQKVRVKARDKMQLKQEVPNLTRSLCALVIKMYLKFQQSSNTDRPGIPKLHN